MTDLDTGFNQNIYYCSVATIFMNAKLKCGQTFVREATCPLKLERHVSLPIRYGSNSLQRIIQYFIVAGAGKKAGVHLLFFSPPYAVFIHLLPICIKVHSLPANERVWKADSVSCPEGPGGARPTNAFWATKNTFHSINFA